MYFIHILSYSVKNIPIGKSYKKLYIGDSTLQEIQQKLAILKIFC